MTRLGVWAFAGSSLLIALVSLRVLALRFELVMPGMAHFVTEAPLRLWGHILGGPLALALAPLQVWPGLRARRPALHRWTGRIYGMAVLVAGLSALTLAPTSEASVFARTGFIVQAVLWLAVTGRGIWLAMAGDLAAHRWWMERSVALTFTAVTLRLAMAPLMAAGWTPPETYQVTAWGAWLFNLAVLELWQCRSRKSKKAPLGAF